MRAPQWPKVYTLLNNGLRYEIILLLTYKNSTFIGEP